MTSAKERAVEAGARANIRDETFPHDVAGMVTARSLAKATIRAAFPILAEELVEIALKHSYSNNYFVSSDATEIAAEIRARIQQMAEAL